MSYPGGQPPQGQPAPGQFPPPQQQFAAPAPNQGGQPQYPGGPQGGPQPWGAPAPGQPQPGGYGQPPAQPQYGSGPYPQPTGQPHAQFGQPGPYGQQPQAAPNDPPGITVDCSYTPMAFLLAITKPKITVNGQQVPNTRWGANHIPVGAGQYHVRVTTPWLFDMGPADVAVPVQPGQAVRYYYRTPALIFLNGAIGPVPQKTPGMVIMYVIWAFVALIFLLNILMIATM